MESGSYRLAGCSRTLRVAHVYDLHYKLHVGYALRISVAQFSANHIQEVPPKELCGGAVCI